MPRKIVSSSAEGRHIRLLDDAVISGIAAGEVIERPASAVKELVENALDAGATTIEVRYDDRDHIDITVADDGHGIAANELPMAVRRHATSKLRTLDELAAIRTFGFRGEALASIAAVADVDVVSRTASSQEATGVRVRAGRVVETYVAGHRVGTRVTVANVFGEIPVRKKFLKAAGAEFGAVADTIRRFALLHPAVGLRVFRNGRTALELPAVKDRQARFEQVLDASSSVTMHEVDATHGGMRLSGYLSAAGESFGSARRVFLFVNGRWVQDRAFFRAVMEGYRTYLMRGRYPAAALFLEIPGERLDVNVHPAKLEVRFVDADAVHRFLVEAVADTLRSRATPLGRWGMTEGDMLASEVQARRATGRRDAGATSLDTVSLLFDGDVEIPGYQPSPAGRGSVGGAAGAAAGTVDARQVELGAELTEPLRVIGQVFRGYILCERAREMVVIDQHAAHERVLYERLLAGVQAARAESQALLTGLTVTVGGERAAAVERASAELARVGWDIERLSDEDVVVRAVPALCAGKDVPALVERLAAELARGGAVFSGLAGVRDILATIACHAATRVGQVLTPTEQRALIDEIASVDFASSCPHGRPVARSLDRARVERMFGR
jgi:DNA mismatch repair protein MutL